MAVPTVQKSARNAAKSVQTVHPMSFASIAVSAATARAARDTSATTVSFVKTAPKWYATAEWDAPLALLFVPNAASTVTSVRMGRYALTAAFV